MKSVYCALVLVAFAAWCWWKSRKKPYIQYPKYIPTDYPVREWATSWVAP